MMRCQQSRRGQVLVLFAVMLPLLLAFVALAVDVVYAFMVKAALVTAVDSAALAGSRAIVNGSAAVAAAVDRTFHANLPDGYLIKGQPSYAPNPPVITTGADGSRSISLTGTARSPTFFLGVFGYSGWDVKAYAKAGRRDINILLILDRSGSLVDAGAWDDVQAAASFFVQQFDDTHDRVGLVSFGTNSRVDYSPQTSFKTPVVNLINNMEARHGNDTNSPMGMYLAYDALRTLNDASAENVIVLFTDGRSDAIPGQFDVRTTGANPKCTSTPKDGVYMTGNSGGPVYGIFTIQPTFSPGTWPTPDYSLIGGCTGLNSSGSNGPQLLTGGFRDSWIPPIGPPVSVLRTATGGSAVDLNNTTNGVNLINMCQNMLLNLAQAARQDPLRIRILTIGLGDEIQESVLEGVANVPPYTMNGQPVGQYVHAPDHTQLLDAFRQVASNISHLVQ
jgi:Flp pilus assembly protein TadG